MKLLISFLLFSLNSVLAQPNVDYKGGLNKLYEFVGMNIQFSAADVKTKRDGKVLMKFKVLNNSEIDSILVVNSVSQSIDSEVLRVLSLTSGNWITDTSDSYLLEVKCSLLYDGKLNYTKLKKSLRRAVKENKVDKIEYYLV